MNDKQADFEEKLNRFSKAYDVEKFNDDTACAIVNIRDNKSLIKSKIRGSSNYIKHEHALNLLTQVYPNVDRNVVSMELIKIGILPPKVIRRILWIITFLIMISIFHTTLWASGLDSDDKVGITILTSLLYYIIHWFILVTCDLYKL